MFEDARQVAQLIDDTLVRADGTLDDLPAACPDAKRHRIAALSVNGWHAPP